MKKIVFINLCLLFTSLSFSQTVKMEFTQKKVVGNELTVYFYVQNLENEEQAQIILEDLLSENGIKSGRYFKAGNGKDRFQLYVNEIITANYVRDILLTHNVDFDYSTVRVNGVIQHPAELPEQVSVMGSKKTEMPEGFPEFSKTGNHELDVDNYRLSKDKWIEENSEQYNQMVKEMEENNKWREK
ncbi:MAG: hypothetical protein PHP52_13895 [Bacteroidales bacterium]|nr:hypothetical protein [Bacteroidales bacterium]MDD4215884.1 hypothetical protein [Bacteroidales bacterium]